MAVEIPYRREIEFEYARCDTLSPLIRRVIANNPSPFSYHGTGTYILGTGNVAVIDPGPADEAHIDAIMAAVEGETISHVLVTHCHMDHSPGCALLRERCDAPTYAYGPHGIRREEAPEGMEEGVDWDYAPDKTIRHGDIIEGGDWSVECVHTPGHTSNHMCFQLREEKALFSGDHVMGWSTSVIVPPDGDMAAYMDSLELLLDRDDALYWPTHGPSIVEPKRHVQAFIDHRRDRERQILDCIKNGTHIIKDMVPIMYVGIDEKLYPAAGRSVFAHVVHLVERGELITDDTVTLEAEYRLP